jgi:hypothetical protein
MKLNLRGLFLAIALSACNTAQGDWNAAVSASNPLNWYRFDELNGTTAVDYGSQHLDGVYGAGALDAQRGIAGRVGTAAQFGDQSTVFLSAPDLTGDWTAEFLLMRTGSKRSSVLIRGVPLALPSQALKLEQFDNTHQIGYTKYGVIDATFSPGATASLNQWVHIAYVNRATADQIRLYVNGDLMGTRTDHFNLSRDQIGSWADTIPESPLAIMDEVVLYNRALPAAEIAAHLAAIPEPSGLILTGAALIAQLLRCRRGVGICASESKK